MTKPHVLLAALFAASTALALPTITSVTPSSGPVAGGTTIIIRGSGFDTQCPPLPQPCGRIGVFIGTLDAASFTVLDTQTIQAVTPPQFPGSVNVGVAMPNGATQLKDAFTYTGEITDAFEPVLVPLYIPLVSGAFGSQFATSLSVWGTTATTVPVFGLGYPCCITTCILCANPKIFEITLRRDIAPKINFGTYGSPGLLVWMPKGGFDQMAASLRVRDLSRASSDWGTALPLVPQREFRDGPLALLDVPMRSGFRDMLRVYSLDPDASVHVRAFRLDGSIAKEFDLNLANGSDTFHPAYAQYGDFPAEDQELLIDIQPNAAGKRLWAFMSVTHNETQHITIVTPH
jgi:hypothetical protein